MLGVSQEREDKGAVNTLALIEAHIEHNWEIYMATLSAIVIAAICCWPEKIPASAQDWWTWARSTFQTAVPAARTQHVNPPQPTPPTEPGNQK